MDLLKRPVVHRLLSVDTTEAAVTVSLPTDPTHGDQFVIRQDGPGRFNLPLRPRPGQALSLATVSPVVVHGPDGPIALIEPGHDAYFVAGRARRPWWAFWRKRVLTWRREW
jgi:hypothetical protein